MSIVATAMTAKADAARSAGDWAGARDFYITALRLLPTHGPALHGLGRLLLDLNQPQAAVDPLEGAVRQEPGRLHWRLDLVTALARARRQEDALIALTPVHRLLPAESGPWRLRASLLDGQGHRQAAIALLRRACRCDPSDPLNHRNLAGLLRAEQALIPAREAYQRVLSLTPADAAAWSSLGGVLGALASGGDDGQGNEIAEQALRRAHRLAPEEPDWTYNLAHHLTGRNRLEEALPLYVAACARTPERAHYHTNRGVCLRGLGDLPGAIAAHRQALALDPEDADARYNLAWALLTAGAWREGWQVHEDRWRLPRFAIHQSPHPAPTWDGSPLAAGETLLVQAEQGLGDTLMAARLLPAARRQAFGNPADSDAESDTRPGTVILEVPPELRRLAGGLDGVDRVITRDAPRPPANARLPLLSLPHRLAITPEHMPGQVPYLHLPSVKRGAGAGQPVPAPPRIGLVWAGSPDNPMDHLRTCPPALLAPLLEIPGISWQSLQFGPAAESLRHPRLARPLDSARDMADTATVVAGLDLVIGVDTAVIHLAGALGRPAWVLLAHVPDYRWMLERTDTPWYPATRLFRQPERGDWAAVVRSVRQALATFLSRTAKNETLD